MDQLYTKLKESTYNRPKSHRVWGSAPGSMVSTKGVNYVGRGSNSTNRHLGR